MATLKREVPAQFCNFGRGECVPGNAVCGGALRHSVVVVKQFVKTLPCIDESYCALKGGVGELL
jgi:hypothetical protein